MWRNKKERLVSARARLILAKSLWGWSPHRGQSRLFRSDAQIRIAACGRRWGKTECLSIDLLTLAVESVRAETPCRQLLVAPTLAQARMIADLCEGLLQDAFEPDPPELADLTWNLQRTPTLVIRIGPKTALAAATGRGKRSRVSQLVFRSAARDGRSLRGFSAHRIMVDEAGYVPDRVLNDVLLPMLTDSGGELLLASSPAGRRNSFYRWFARGTALGTQTALSPQLLLPKTAEGEQDLSSPSPFLSSPSPFLRGGPGRGSEPAGTAGVRASDSLSIASFQCASGQNTHLSKAYLSAMEDELGVEAFSVEYGAQFLDDYGAVFSADDLRDALQEDSRVRRSSEGHLISVPEPGRLYTAGVDWGRSQDYTVLCILDAEEVPARLVGLWRWRGGSWQSLTERVAERIALFLPPRVLTDSTGGGNALEGALQEAIRRRITEPHSGPPLKQGEGEPHPGPPLKQGEGGYEGRIPQVEGFIFGASSKTLLIDTLALGLSAHALTYPPHKALRAEMDSFSYGKPGPSGRVPTAAAGAGHDDTVIALALAWFLVPPSAEHLPLPELLLLGSAIGLPKRESG